MTTQDLRLGEKQCSKCGRWQNRDVFPVNLQLSSGLSSWCRGCHNEASREWRARNPEAVAAANAKRRVEAYPPKPCAVCAETFVPVRHDQIYCTPVCKRRRRRRAAA